jgi:PKD repeat protein
MYCRFCVQATALLLLGAFFITSAPSQASMLDSAAQRAALKIVVIQGEDAVNIIQQRTAVAPIVEVRDQNDLPVAGIPVTFAVGAGKGASFAGGAQTITVVTNAAGRAAAAGWTPLTSGAVQVNVTAAVQGQTLAATITQTNFLTAAQAAQAGATVSTGSSGAAGGAGGGGLSNTAIVGIAGAAGAGALLAANLGSDSEPDPAPVNRSPEISALTASSPLALHGATRVNFSAVLSDPENNPLTLRWDFGDGGTSVETAPTYVFNETGTFTVRLTVSDGQASATRQTDVVVRSVSGTWRGTMTCPPARCGQLVQLSITVTATQSGREITGTSTQVAPGASSADTCVFSTGTVTDPRRVYFGQLQSCSLTPLNYGGCFGELDPSLNRMLPDTTGQSLTCDLVRQ